MLETWARGEEPNDLFTEVRVNAMREAIAEIDAAQQTLGKNIWSADIKATDEYWTRSSDATTR